MKNLYYGKLNLTATTSKCPWATQVMIEVQQQMYSQYYLQLLFLYALEEHFPLHQHSTK